MSAYREAPPSIRCPRCGEAMEQVDREVRRCLGCQGVWAARSVLEAAVPDWDGGVGAWWHAELACPEPHAQQQMLTPRTLAGVTIDVCSAHGAWFDRGELARILRSDGDDLAALKAALPSFAGDELASDDVAYLERELAQSKIELRRMREKVAALEERIATLKR